jgi:hypothetical protein
VREYLAHTLRHTILDRVNSRVHRSRHQVVPLLVCVSKTLWSLLKFLLQQQIYKTSENNCAARSNRPHILSKEGGK